MVFTSSKASKLDAFGPAERDLRLLSSKAAEVYKHSKFDLLLAKLHVIPIWVFLVFAAATLGQIAPGMFPVTCFHRHYFHWRYLPTHPKVLLFLFVSSCQGV